MRRLGEPQRKIFRLEKQLSEEETHAKADSAGKQPKVRDSEKKGSTDGPGRETGAQKRRRRIARGGSKIKARKEREAMKAGRRSGKKI